MKRRFLAALLVAVVLLVVVVPLLHTSNLPMADIGSSGYAPATP